MMSSPSSTLVGLRSLDPLFSSAWKGDGAVVVRDAISRPGRRLFKSLSKRALEKLPSELGNKGLSCISVVVCCCERPLEEHEQEWSRRGIERVAFIDAAAPTWAAMKGEELPSNSKGNVFSPEELSAEALQHAITDAVQSTVSRTPMEGARESHAETRGLLFIVDSISLLLNLYSGEKKDEGKVVGAITSTLKAKMFTHRCLFALAHADTVPVSSLRLLDLVSSSVLSMEKKDVVLLRHRRSNGKISEKLFKIKINDNDSLTSVEALKSEERANVEAEAEKEADELASMLRGGVSFNLALSSEEKAARAAVVLPHMFHLHGADGSGEAAAPKGSVYVSDSDEEIDDEDLDEDLDV